jgi:hypothetical protein
LEIRQVNIPQSHNRKQNPIDVIENPVLGEVESHHWDGANDASDDACRGNIEVVDFQEGFYEFIGLDVCENLFQGVRERYVGLDHT